jgi:5-amino-6-(5-phospho-D-ribitylamino)uracil phosphatase
MNGVGEILFVGSAAFTIVANVLLKAAETKKYKYIALDLDGTTLNSHHELSVRTRAVLRELNAKGVQICIATGRSTASVIKYVEILDLQQDSVPAVCFNGGCGVEISRTGLVKSIFESPLTASSAEDLIKFAGSLGLCVQYYIGRTGDVYAVPTTPDHRELLGRYAELTGKEQICVDTYAIPQAISLPAKILIMTDDADGLIAAANRAFPQGKYHIIRGSPAPFFVEFLTPGASKGRGLERVCESRGVSLDDVIAFGDGENDEEFLRTAGRGFAMKNAKPLAKAAADEVLQWTNDEDGVARQLEHMSNTHCFA